MIALPDSFVDVVLKNSSRRAQSEGLCLLDTHGQWLARQSLVILCKRIADITDIVGSENVADLVACSQFQILLAEAGTTLGVSGNRIEYIHADLERSLILGCESDVTWEFLRSTEKAVSYTSDLVLGSQTLIARFPLNLNLPIPRKSWDCQLPINRIDLEISTPNIPKMSSRLPFLQAAFNSSLPHVNLEISSKTRQQEFLEKMAFITNSIGLRTEKIPSDRLTESEMRLKVLNEACDRTLRTPPFLDLWKADLLSFARLDFMLKDIPRIRLIPFLESCRVFTFTKDEKIPCDNELFAVIAGEVEMYVTSSSSGTEKSEYEPHRPVSRSTEATTRPFTGSTRRGSLSSVPLTAPIMLAVLRPFQWFDLGSMNFFAVGGSKGARVLRVGHKKVRQILGETKHLEISSFLKDWIPHDWERVVHKRTQEMILRDKVRKVCASMT